MGSQFIFSNSVKPIWVSLSKFRQKQMHLFWSFCNFDFALAAIFKNTDFLLMLELFKSYKIEYELAFFFFLFGTLVLLFSN